MSGFHCLPDEFFFYLRRARSDLDRAIAVALVCEVRFDEPLRGVVFVNTKDLADDLKTRPQRVREALSRLEKADVILRLEPVAKSLVLKGQSVAVPVAADRAYLVVGYGGRGEASPKPVSVPVAKPVAKPVPLLSSIANTPNTPIGDGPDLELFSEDETTLDGDFEAFWKSYPVSRRTGLSKAKAKGKFRAAVKRYGLAKVAGIAEEMLAAREEQYLPSLRSLFVWDRGYFETDFEPALTGAQASTVAALVGAVSNVDENGRQLA